MKIIECNNCYAILKVAVKQKYIKGYIFLNLSQNKVVFILFFNQISYF